MAAFQNIKGFNEELQRDIALLKWNIDVKSYEDLKKNPRAYNFFEDESYLRFFVKDRKNGRMKKILIVTAIAYNRGVILKNTGISFPDFDFLNRITKNDKWWL